MISRTSITARGWILAGIVAYAVLLRVLFLGRESLWLDELAAIDVARQSFADLVRFLHRGDVHPPLYFAMLKVWCTVFGTDEWATRGLSVLLGVAAVLAAASLGRRLGTPRSGLVAAALVASSPFCVYYAREARAYSLLLALSLLATDVLLAAEARRFAWRWLALYVALAAALPYTHVYGWFTLGAHAVYALTLPAGRARVLGGLAMSAAAFLPWLPIQLDQIHRVEAGFWIARPAPLEWTRAWLAEGPLAVAWVVVTIGAALATLRRGTRPTVLLSAGVLVPTVVPLLLSCAGEPVFVGKYAIASAGFVLVAAAPALARLSWPWLVVLLAIGAGETVRDVYLHRHKEQWREAARFVSGTGSPVVMTVGYQAELAHYLSPGVTSLRAEARDLRSGAFAARLEAASADRFWLVNVHPPATDPLLAPLFLARWVPCARRTWHQAEAILWVDVRALPSHPMMAGGER